MKPSVKTLGEILYAPSQYVIPVFQRNYRWEIKEWAKFWASLEDIQEPTKRGNHFMGFLVFVPGLPQPGQHTTFHLIDGQQRLTTSSLLLAAIRNVARQHGQEELAEEVHAYYLVHPLKSEEQHYRLLPKERDHDSYIAVIDGRANATGRIADGVAFFEERLGPIGAAENGALRNFFNVVVQRLEFMCATLEAENAYNIFKSLNSTGVALGPADLIRNFVFMHVPPDGHDRFDRDRWGPVEDHFTKSDGTLDEERLSRFFRDFLMSSGRYIPPKDTFAQFEAKFEATGFVPDELAAELLTNCSYYAIISGAAPDADPRVTAALAGLNALESSTTYPLVLAVFQRRTLGLVTDAQLAQAVEMLQGFILRRFVCGDSSRGYGQMFVRAIAKEEGNTLQELEAYLLERGWPDDVRFADEFVRFPLYQRGYKHEVLAALERARGHKEPADLANAQVEHIMPQTLNAAWIEALGPDAGRIHAEWLHRPGNLTLSGYNPELWNHPFHVKRERYAQSNITLTRELTEYTSWKESEIHKRGRKLAAEAVRIWTGPAAPTGPSISPEGSTEQVNRRELRSQFWTGLSEYLTAEHPALPELEPRPNWTIRLTSGVRHVSFELRFGLKHDVVGIDVWFWKIASRGLWERVRQNHGEYDALIEAGWRFEPPDGSDRARMFVDHTEADVRNESKWPALYAWFGRHLEILYAEVAPRLRAEMDRLSTSPQTERA